MKALSVRPPWARQIVNGTKTTEYRTWPAPAWLIGHRLYIHQSGPNGAIIGSVTLRACRKVGNVWHWLLTEPTSYHQPIPMKGRLGLWNVPVGLTLEV
jgi:predicted transcriptional regulator